MKLRVPFRSQWGSSANASRDDCGPAALCSVLAAYGINATVDAVFKATGAPANSYISFNQLIFAGKAFKFTTEHHIISLNELKRKIQDGYPAVALVNYRYFPNKQDKYTGPHFITVFGTTDHSVFCHDPNRLSGTYGDSIELSDTDFSKMWEQTNLEHGNKNNQVLIPGRPMEGGDDSMTKEEKALVDDIVHDLRNIEKEVRVGMVEQIDDVARAAEKRFSGLVDRITGVENRFEERADELGAEIQTLRLAIKDLQKQLKEVINGANTEQTEEQEISGILSRLISILGGIFRRRA